METPHTGPGMWKPLIMHQRSTSNAKYINQTRQLHTIDRL